MALAFGTPDVFLSLELLALRIALRLAHRLVCGGGVWLCHGHVGAAPVTELTVPALCGVWSVVLVCGG